MDKTELTLKIHEVIIECERRIKNLLKRFAFENCEWDLGDFIETNEGKFIIVAKHAVTITNPPQVMFTAKKLNQDNSVSKKGRFVKILQHDVVRGIRFNTKKL